LPAHESARPDGPGVRLPERVTIVEVGPRDGLQSLAEPYPLEVKLEMIELLAESGLQKIEVTAFVRPDVIPQLADADEVLRRVRRINGCVYRALVPNRRGAERAAAARVDEMLGLITASDTYNRKNSNMTVEENLEAIGEIATVARQATTHLVVAIGIAMFCPYEGEVPEERVLALIDRMRRDGVEEFYVATSVGLDGPRKVNRLCSMILDRWPELTLGIHLHNTNGMALANALAAADAGVSVFEGSICGIGGGIRMPYGMPHYGNVATEDLVHMFSEMGVDTGVDLQRLLATGRRIKELLALETTFSHALQGGTKADVLERGRVSPRDR
jgi:hydroxymethylglutaryl-CoA lyase